MTRVWGSTELDDSDYFDPDPRRHDAVGWDAQASWARSLAAIDGDAGVAVWTRARLGDEAWWDDWEVREEVGDGPAD